MTDALAPKPEDILTPFESEQLAKWKRSKDLAPLSPIVAVRMYELFLLGHSCEEIFRANEQKFPLGMILDARLRHDWDRRRDAYIESLYNEAGNSVKQRTVESAMFLGDLLAAAHIQHGDKLRKFIQTKDVNDLPDELKIDTITKYKMVIDAFKFVTGQADQKGGTPAVQVIGNNVTLQEQPKQKAQTSGQDALSILKALDQLDKK